MVFADTVEFEGMELQAITHRICFDAFEVHLESGELWRAGRRVKLQGQPSKVLVLLLEQPGKLVTREELQWRLWGKQDTLVGFDHSLGIAINKVRDALGDSADHPRFIETLPRRGYRFIAAAETFVIPLEVTHAVEGATASLPGPPLQLSPAATSSFSESTLLSEDEGASRIEPALPSSSPSPEVPLVPATVKTRTWSHAGLAILAGVLLALGLVVGALLAHSRRVAEPPRIRQLTHDSHLAVDFEATENLAAGVTDGVHIFVPVSQGGATHIAMVGVAGGRLEVVNLPEEIRNPTLGDISPDGTQLLLRERRSADSEQPLWVVPTTGGSSVQVGNTLAHDATWMPDGVRILYASGNELYTTDLTGSSRRLFASLPGRALWLRWRPGGKLLRFTLIDPLSHTLSLWQLTDVDPIPVPVLPNFTFPSTECCGVWTADGGSFIFRSSAGGNIDLWRLEGDSRTNPKRLTDGPLEFESPIGSHDGKQLFFVGVAQHSQLERIGLTGPVVQHNFLAAACRVNYSPDHRWVVWTDNAGLLWRAAADGTLKVQLTRANLDVFLARWSPDGKNLALMAREPGKAWNIYLIPATGGELRALLEEPHNVADPSWSRDGESIVFGGVNDVLGKEPASHTLRILNLRTRRIEVLPDSDGLFSPRWSPDGRSIAALSLDQRQVRLFDVQTRRWSALPFASGADPAWSADSRYLFVHSSLEPQQPILRLDMQTGSVATIAQLVDNNSSDSVDFIFSGLDEEDRPLVRTRTATGDLYMMPAP